MYEAVTFGGGGTRCFWQGGFLSAVSEDIGLRPNRIAAVSGGALSASVYTAGLANRLLDIMTDRFSRRDSNMDPEAITDHRDVLPHHSLYRDIVESTFAEKEAVEAVAEGPAFSVHLARPLKGPGRLGAVATIAVYELDLHWRSSPHQLYARRAGAEPIIVDGRQAARDGRLVDLIVTAAAVPPLFPIRHWDGDKVIDGGVIDNAPRPDCKDGETCLMLLTRRYRHIPERDGCVYVYPSEEVPTDKADFSDPDGVRRTFELGCDDGHAFLRAQRKAA
ncbi:patatin-like phospholipase family protein [Amorphus orientalis]|uniref:Acylesterase/phospholipase RssA n=1 Tax=Amorphus orientalis TaxID=649198 RepID=A0AAE3VK99_9HYPH|nr:patatin-like phospholipase family protein [Amorphus orientalis]MDQ0313567.1 putative acylesterase/phospholipase RssA [Amorphus orientalis]